jgi:purine nucleosidase
LTRRIILDCDPGHDDAMAILLARGTPEIELAAITTVAGNHTLDLTTLNARRVCTLAGITDVPVAAGCSAPLVRPLVTATEIHGTTGLQGHVWGDPTVDVISEHAVDLIIELVMAAPGEITLVPTGPLTNIAMALRKEPRIAGRVREVVLMGGSYTRGNVTPAAEFNVYVDPEAAAAVFAAGWPLTMIGLDVTHMANATAEVLARVGALGTELAAAVVGMLAFYRDRQLHEFGTASPHVHDPCAVACVARPDLVSCSEARVEIELAGALTRGMTVTDFRMRDGVKPNAMVGTSIDEGAFWDMFVAAIERIPAREVA